MAKQKHLDILRQEVDAWNKWREKAVDVTPNLHKANLNALDLIGSDFAATKFMIFDRKSM